MIRIGVGSESFLSIFCVMRRIKASSTERTKNRKKLTGSLKFISLNAGNRVCDELHQTLVVLEHLNSISNINDKENDFQESNSDLYRDVSIEENLGLKPKTKNLINFVIQLGLISNFLYNLLVELSFSILVLFLVCHQSVWIVVIEQQLLNTKQKSRQ